MEDTVTQPALMIIAEYNATRSPALETPSGIACPQCEREMLIGPEQLLDTRLESLRRVRRVRCAECGCVDYVHA